MKSDTYPKSYIVMDDIFKKLENSKRLKWTALSLVPTFAIFVMLKGFLGAGLQILAVYGGRFTGILAGHLLGKFAMRLWGKENTNLESRLCSGLSCFGFLLLPRMIFSWSNALLGNGVDEGLFAESIWVACFGGVLFFILGSFKAND